MRNIYKAILMVCFFVMSLLLCFWWRSGESVFTDEFALRKIFENYNSQCDCSELKGITSYYKSYEKEKYGVLIHFDDPDKGFIRNENLNRHQVALISNLEDGAKLVVTTSKSFDGKSGKILDCDGCGSWLSIGVFNKINSKWVLIDKAIHLYGDGAMGRSPEIYLNNKGDQDWFEITVAHSYFLHGEDDEAKVKLVYQKGMWTSVDLLAKK